MVEYWPAALQKDVNTLVVCAFVWFFLGVNVRGSDAFDNKEGMEVEQSRIIALHHATSCLLLASWVMHRVTCRFRIDVRVPIVHERLESSEENLAFPEDMPAVFRRTETCVHIGLSWCTWFRGILKPKETYNSDTMKETAVAREPWRATRALP